VSTNRAHRANRGAARTAGDATDQRFERTRPIASMSFAPTSQIPVNETTGTFSDASEIFVDNFNGLYLLMCEALSIQLLREAYAKTGDIGFLRRLAVA